MQFHLSAPSMATSTAIKWQLSLRNFLKKLKKGFRDNFPGRHDGLQDRLRGRGLRLHDDCRRFGRHDDFLRFGLHDDLRRLGERHDDFRRLGDRHDEARRRTGRRHEDDRRRGFRRHEDDRRRGEPHDGFLFRGHDGLRRAGLRRFPHDEPRRDASHGLHDSCFGFNNSGHEGPLEGHLEPIDVVFLARMLNNCNI